MNRSLKLLAALSLSALVFAAPVRAEDKPADNAPKKEKGGARAGGGADRLQAMADKLNLTDDQKKQAAPIIAETKEAVQKIMADNTLERKDKGPKLQEATKAGIDKLTALLTPEQKEELKKIQEENKKAREGGARKGGGDGAPKNGPKDTGAPKQGGDKN